VPVPDFWGVRLPGNPSLSAPAPALPSGTSSITAPTIAREQKPQQKIAEFKTVASPAAISEPVPMTSPAAPPASSPAAAETVAPALPAPAKPAPQIIEFKPAVAPPSTASLAAALSDLLATGPSGPESKVPEKSLQAEEKKVLPAAPETQNKTNAALVSTLVQNPAPGSATFDLAAEEVKIPAWLEPLARNSAPAPAPAKESHPTFEPETDGLSVAEVPAISSHEEPVLAPLGEVRGPNFGSGLALDGRTSSERSSGGAWKIIVAVVILAAVAAGAWYWYSNQPKASAAGNYSTESSVERAPAPEASANAPATSRQPLTSETPNSSAEPAAVNPSASASVPPATRPAATPAREARPANTAVMPEIVPVKKPTLGDVHLAAPKVKRKASGGADENSAEPGLALNGASAGDPADGAGLLSSKGKQPAAPLPVGGDVKPARLVSSVPPVYPQLARSQRLGGDVTLDALIDANGRVSALKVLSGPAMLHQAAIDAVKQWKYHPATLNDQPTSMHLTVTVQFRLQ